MEALNHGDKENTMEFLDRIARDACEKNPTRYPMVPVRWGLWIVATDGTVLAAIPDDGRPDMPQPSWARGAPRGPAYDQLSADMVEPVEFSLDALRAWLGEAEPVCSKCHGDGGEACERCGGSGYIDCHCLSCGDDHDAKCGSCRGTGGGCDACGGQGRFNKTTVRRVVLFGDARVNAAQLAYLLDGAPGETVRLSHVGGGTDPLKVEGEGWRGIVMGLRLVGDAEYPTDALTLDAVMAPAS